MSAMDTESGQSANEDVNLGKRKRSPNESSANRWSGIFQTPEDHLLGHRLPYPGGVQLPKKPKVGASTLALDSDGDTAVPDSLLDTSLMDLPDQVLQHVLSFLDPFSLARVMCVNHRLSGLLYPQHALPRSSGLPLRQPSLNPELIWSCSRKSHIPGMPHPLKGVTEFGMFKLVFGKRCQVCGLLPKVSSLKLATAPWNSGPGPRGVRAIWPFKSRLCANCLQPLLLKEADLAQLTFSELQRGLASVSFTPSLHYVPSITLLQTAKPPRLSLTEYYSRPQLDELLQLSPDIVTEKGILNTSRLKDLDALRKEAETDALRLEAWELSQNADNEVADTSYDMAGGRSSASGSSLHSDMRTRSFITSSSSAYRPQAQASTSNIIHAGPFPTQASSQRPNFESQMLPPQADGRAIQFSKAASLNLYTPLRMRQSSEPPNFSGRRPPVNIEQKKAERRADIEGRCMKLDPPLTAQILEKLPTFQSAVQFPGPLDEVSWEHLKIRLLEEKVKEDSLSSAGFNTYSRMSSPGGTTGIRLRTPPEVHTEDDPRTHAFRPVREKLHEFAGELIRHRYAQGNNLTQSSAPQFAADVLLHVRKRFYENQAREDEAFAAHGQQPPDEGPSGARARVLRLEHMKYVFDSSIKPLTEFVRKDLFLCSMCDTQGRHFAFEAIIQHYASKHTDDFSRGSAVVYWKATWPENPPFHPYPSADSEWMTDQTQLHTASNAPTSFQSSRSFRALSSTAVGSEHRGLPSATGFREIVDSQHGDSWDRRPLQGADTHAGSVATSVSQHWSRSFGPDMTHSYRHPSPSAQQQHLPSYESLTHIPRNGPWENRFFSSFPHETRSQSTGSGYHQGQQGNRHHQEQPQVLPESTRGYREQHDNDTTRVYDHPSYVKARHDEFAPYNSANPHSSSFSNQPRQSARDYRYDAEAIAQEDTMDYQSVPQSSVKRGTTVEAQMDNRHEAAERFLNALSTGEVGAYDKEPLGRYYVREDQQAHIAEELYWRETTADRRSNMSQPLRRSRSSIGEEKLPHPSEPLTGPIDIIIPRNREDRQSVSVPHPAREEGPIYLPRDEHSLYQSERPAQAPVSVPSDSQSYHTSPPSRYETRVTIPQASLVQHVDRPGRQLDMPSHEMRYIDGSPGRGASYNERMRYSHEGPIFGHRYERQSYDSRAAVWDPEMGQHYIERRVREYLPESRYVRYERILDRDDVHNNDQSRYHRPSVRPTSSDQRYREHQ